MDSEKGSITANAIGFRIFGWNNQQIAEYWTRDYPNMIVNYHDTFIVVFKEKDRPLIIFNIEQIARVVYEYD